jgi:hypothetical protein
MRVESQPSAPVEHALPANPPTPVGKGPDSAQTVSDIRGKLASDGGVFEDDVTHDELRQIAAGLGALDARGANEAVSQLTDDELRKISGELQGGGLGNFDGLGFAERKDVLGDLAGKLDATQFERVARAYGSPTEVAGVVAERGSNEAKIGFIRAHAADVSGGNGFDPEKSAVATVLASLDADGLQSALLGKPPALNSEQLQAVVDPNVQHAGRGPVYVSAHTLNTILETAAQSGNAELKALVFDKAATSLADIQELGGQGNAQQVASSLGEHMAALLRTDTNGIVNVIEDSDPGGTGLKTFATQQITDGKTEGLSDMLKSLRNGPNNDPAGYLADVKHAHNLGYAIGAIGAGVEDLKKNAADKAELLGGLLGSLLGELPVGGSAASVISQGVLDNSVGEVGGDKTGLPEALYSAVIDQLSETQQGNIDTTLVRVLGLQNISR